jgi:Flp pilus assembly protein TadB
VIGALLIGAGLGFGLLLVARAFSGRQVGLAVALAAIERRPAPEVTPLRQHERLGLGVVGLLGGTHRVAADLRVTGRTSARHAVEKLAAALAGFVVPLLVGVVLVGGGVVVPAGAVAAAALGFAAAGFLLPDLLLRRTAAARRAAFTAALSSYLDLVTVVLAGGAGTETALELAAEAGDGWAFAELRRALARSRALRQSPWDCFAELGDELGVATLQELAASVRLAGQQGARVRASLAAKAASLRGHQLATVEAAAQSASERMALPTVLLFTGFLLFIGYPAVAEILGSSNW